MTLKKANHIHKCELGRFGFCVMQVFTPRNIYISDSLHPRKFGLQNKIALKQAASMRHSLHKEKIKGSLGMGTWFKKKLAGLQKKALDLRAASIQGPALFQYTHSRRGCNRKSHKTQNYLGRTKKRAAHCIPSLSGDFYCLLDKESTGVLLITFIYIWTEPLL